MNSRERILMSLEHKEPDHVPYDLGGSHVTTISAKAYKNLCEHLGISAEPIEYSDVYQQVVVPNNEMLDKFEVDTRGLYPLCSHNWNVKGHDVGEYYEHTDEWGFVQRFPKENGLYWSLVKSPIDGMIADANVLKNFQWPIADNPQRIAGLRTQALKYREQGKIVIMKGLCAGLFEMGQRIRGMENFLCDMLADTVTAEYILDKMMELKKAFWKMALDELGDVVDIVVETDDYGTQESQLVSFDLYKKLISPRLKNIVAFMKTELARKKKNGEKGYVFLHSCGNVRPFISDFIDAGIDIINPVHITAAGMEPSALKKDFGDHITFWGGGVETQSILPNGSVSEIKENVKRNMEALMPGGGFVFSTVHNIQGDVSPQNIMAMREAFLENRKYR